VTTKSLIKSAVAQSVSILAFGDLHYATEPPESRTPTYRNELDAMLDEVAEFSKRFAVNAIVQAGDHFHRKGRTSHADVMALIGKYQAIQRVAPLLSIAGNHDMVGHNHASVYESQPLGVVIKSKAVSLVDADIAIVRSADLRVGVFGLNYTPGPSPASIAATVAKIVDARAMDAAVVVLHHDIIGRLNMQGYLLAIRKVTGVPTLVLNGHIHEPTEIVTSGDSTIINLGSIARTSIAEKNNQPSAVLATFTKGKAPKVTIIPFSGALPIAEAFDQTAINAPPASTDLDTFVELVGGEGDDTRMDARTELRGLARELQVPDDHLNEAVRLIEVG